MRQEAPDPADILIGVGLQDNAAELIFQNLYLSPRFDLMFSAKRGRDHNPFGFTMWLAGGAVKGGTIYGATDDFGFKAIEKPAHVHDIHATILYLMGIDHKKLTYRYSGRDFRLTDVAGNVLHELIA